MEEYDHLKTTFTVLLERSEEDASQVVEGGCAVDQEALECVVELRYVACGCISELVGRP